MFQTLASTGYDPSQTSGHQEHPSHTFLPQCRLRHRPFPRLLQDQADTKEVTPIQEAGKPPPIDDSKMYQSDLVQQFAEAFECQYNAHLHNNNLSMTVTVRWETFRIIRIIHKTALTTFGRKTSILESCHSKCRYYESLQRRQQEWPLHGTQKDLLPF